jgi:hypothetical protein
LRKITSAFFSLSFLSESGFNLWSDGPVGSRRAAQVQCISRKRQDIPDNSQKHNHRVRTNVLQSLKKKDT